MAWRLKLAPEKTNIDFFAAQWLTFGGSMLLMVLSFVAWGVMGLNFGIDFQGGTTIRTESTTVVDVAAYREALSSLDLGDVAITEVFDPSFRDNQHVAMIRIAALDGAEAVTQETLETVRVALVTMDPDHGGGGDQYRCDGLYLAAVRMAVRAWRRFGAVA